MRSLALLFCLSSLSAIGQTFYVATDGNDSWNGTSPVFTSGTTGPWLTFQKWNIRTAAGETLYVRGGIYEALGESTWYTIRHTSAHSGTQGSPIVITNYPGEIPVLYLSYTNNERIYLNGCAWVQIHGLVISNAYRSVFWQLVNNCTFAGNTVTGRGNGVTDPGGTLGVRIYNNCYNNWVHHNLIKDGNYSNVGDAGHGITVGLFYTLTDTTSHNIIESNVCYWAGHDPMSVYGYSNVIRGNFIHNEAWYFRNDWQTLAGHRAFEIGGQIGNYNVVEGNRFQHAATHGGAHGIESSSGYGAIIRNNELINCDYSGLTLYGKGFACGTNFSYNNTIAFNGFGPRYQTNYDVNTNITSTSDHINWKYAVSLSSTTNNFFVNNILWGNYLDARVDIGGTVPGGYRWDNNLVSDPLFVNSTDGGPFSQTQPDVHLTTGSPSIDGGTWLTTITSASSSGTSFDVNRSGYFFAGLTAAARTLPGDTIQLQGQTATATITAISGNTITVNSSLTWTNGQGVSLPYNGTAPDVGAYETAFLVDPLAPTYNVNPPRSQRSFGAISSGP